MTFSQFDFDVITDPALQQRRVPWIPLHRPRPSSDAAEAPEPVPDAGQATPGSA